LGIETGTRTVVAERGVAGMSNVRGEKVVFHSGKRFRGHLVAVGKKESMLAEGKASGGG